MSDAFPLGRPVNRPPPKGLTPVEGRPGWWRDPYTGVERCIEPPRPAEQLPLLLFDTQLPEIDDEFWPCVSDEE